MASNLDELQNLSDEFLKDRDDLRGEDLQKDWRLLLTDKEIEKGINECAKALNIYFKGKEVVVVCVLKGASYFFVDLTRKLTVPFSCHFVEASSYQDSQTQSEVVQISSSYNSKDFEGKHVLIIDELFDNGKTLQSIHQYFEDKGTPKKDIFTCTLFLKQKDVKTEYDKPDLYSIVLPDVWVVGYGLDVCQEKRGWTYLYACPKMEGVPKSKDDQMFEDDDYYENVRSILVNNLSK